MASEVKKFYEFGKFCFDAARLRLEHEGETVPLPPKSLEALKVLLEEKGETVTRENFLGKIWAESYVEDANLTVAVSTLRKTLSVYENETFIQTVPRKGYRFVGDARVKIEISEEPIIIERRAVEQLTVEKISARPAKTSRSGFYLLSALFSLIGMVGAFTIWQRAGNAAAYLSKNQPASEAFLKGDTLLQKRQVCESIPYFREAIAKDETHVRAYANLSAALAMCGDATDEADQTINKALALEPNLSDVQATDGFIKMFRHWDWGEAENSLRRAVALDPNSAKAHHWLAVLLSIRGRFREASGEIRRAIEIKPASPLYHADLCQVYYFEANTDAALDECRKALEIDTDFVFTSAYLREIYLMRGDERKAFEYHAKYFRYSPETLKRAEEVFEHEGFKEVLKEQIPGVLYDAENNPSSRTAAQMRLADIYAELGEHEKVLRWLEEAVSSEKSACPFKMAYLAVEPRYAFLRDEPRFQAILKRMNLAN